VATFLSDIVRKSQSSYRSGEYYVLIDDSVLSRAVGKKCDT